MQLSGQLRVPAVGLPEGTPVRDVLTQEVYGASRGLPYEQWSNAYAMLEKALEQPDRVVAGHSIQAQERSRDKAGPLSQAPAHAQAPMPGAVIVAGDWMRWLAAAGVVLALACFVASVLRKRGLGSGPVTEEKLPGHPR